MPLKKTYVLVVRSRDEGIDFYREGAPVFKKETDCRQGQRPLPEQGHEGPLSDLLFPSLKNFRIELIDIGLGLLLAHLDAELGLF